MKLKTLVDIQRCYHLLREAEKNQKPLSGEQYVECLKAQTVFDYELELITKPQTVKVTDWAAA